MMNTENTPVSMPTKPAIALPWLVRLRWGYIVCQVVLIYLVILAYDIPAPRHLIAIILLFEVFSNAALHFLMIRDDEVTVGATFALFLLDALFLTALLFATGGAMNPFTFLYLVHVVLGAIVLPGKWPWMLGVWTALLYLLLFLPVSETVIPLPGADYILTGPICTMVSDSGGPLRLHLQGMWVAFAVTAFFIVLFAGKIQVALAQQEATKEQLKDEKQRGEKLASLASLAAGAAHELSTPLATIAVASGDMIYTLKGSDQREAMEDAKLIKEQVAQCKEILYEMTAGAGELLGEELKKFPAQEAAQEVVESFTGSERRRIVMNIAPNVSEHLFLPFRTFCRTLRSLVKNGLEASSHPEVVTVNWVKRGTMLFLEVVDGGEGMDEETVQRSLEPFFTTKGDGMGLGLFLANTMAERFNGKLDIQSKPEAGTTVTLSLETG
jgi:two-component system sensor histidine kinase RegB